MIEHCISPSENIVVLLVSFLQEIFPAKSYQTEISKKNTANKHDFTIRIELPHSIALGTGFIRLYPTDLKVRTAWYGHDNIHVPHGVHAEMNNVYET